MIKLFQAQPGPVIAGTQDIAGHTLKFLAQGDSWFSFGALIPWATGNLLDGVALNQDACAVNCARPGKELVHMVDSRRDPEFINLLLGRVAWAWDGILLSGGGNDLIDAIQTPPVDASGKPVPPELRILLTQAERGTDPLPNAADYLSPTGWATFETHLVAQFHEFVATRDDPRSQCQGKPIFLHSYDFIMPRNAGAGLNFGPWLYPAMQQYGIAPAQWFDLSKYLLSQLSAVLLQLNLPAVYVAQTQGTCIPAAAGSTGNSNDYENEIHPNPGGYAKLGVVYSQLINQTLGL